MMRIHKLFSSNFYFFRPQLLLTTTGAQREPLQKTIPPPSLKNSDLIQSNQSQPEVPPHWLSTWQPLRTGSLICIRPWNQPWILWNGWYARLKRNMCPWTTLTFQRVTLGCCFLHFRYLMWDRKWQWQLNSDWNTRILSTTQTLDVCMRENINLNVWGNC